MNGRSIRSRAPAASSPQVRRVMQSNVGRETRPEERIRNVLDAAGATFLTEVRPEPSLRCKADFVFPKQRMCVFVDGCFWHRCPNHFELPKSNVAWWREKIAATVERDRRQAEELRRFGWTVLRVWEHDTAPHRLAETAAHILGPLGLVVKT